MIYFPDFPKLLRLDPCLGTIVQSQAHKSDLNHKLKL